VAVGFFFDKLFDDFEISRISLKITFFVVCINDRKITSKKFLTLKMAKIQRKPKVLPNKAILRT